MKSLVARGVPINTFDREDNLPLYLASLCNHIDVVRFLLESGAVCDAGSFEGERTLYAAPTIEMRKLLALYGLTIDIAATNVIVDLLKQYFRENKADPSHKGEISLNCVDSVKVHRVALAVFCPGIRTRLAKNYIEGNLSIDLFEEGNGTMDDFVALKFIIKYLYGGFVLRTLAEGVTSDSLWKTATYLELDDRFLTALGLQVDARDPRTRAVLEKTLGVPQHVAINEKSVTKLKKRANSVLVDYAADAFFEWYRNGEDLMPDLTLVYTWENEVFELPGHEFVMKVGFVEQAKAWDGIVKKHSSITDSAGADKLGIRLIDLGEQIPVLVRLAVENLYGSSEEIPIEWAVQALEFADYILLSSLVLATQKTIMNAFRGAFSKSLDDRTNELCSLENVSLLLRALWQWNLQNLTFLMSKVLATRLEEYVSSPLLRELIVESYDSLESREEYDTIELVDDIRFYLTQRTDLSQEVYDRFMDMVEDVEREKENEKKHLGSLLNGDD